MRKLNKVITNKEKKRHSVPARILELLYTDDAFYNDVMKIKRSVASSKFPKSDEWRDSEGFNISFALAGYSPEDVEVSVDGNVLTVRGDGMDSLAKEELKIEEDAAKPYSREGKPRIHMGAISRGIARRKFCVKFLISEDFDLSGSRAKMEHGLLHIFMPNNTESNYKDIKVEGAK